MESLPAADSRRIATLLGLLFGVASMGSSTASVVLPDIGDAFGISAAAAAWSVSLYVLTLGITTALYGRISDLVGVRGPLATGLAMLMCGAALAAFAPTYPAHLAGRVLQGAGAAAVPTLGVAAITARYEGAVRRASLGRLAGMAAVLSGMGPVIGGAAEVLAGWRLAIVLPALSVLVLPFVWRSVPTEGVGGSLDVVGAVLVAGTAGGTVLLLQSPSSGLTVALVGIALVIVATPAAILWVRREPLGFLPRCVITDPIVVRCGAAGASIIAGWFALFVSVPAILLADGWEAWQVGLLLLPGAAIGFFTPRLAGPLLLRMGSIQALRGSCLAASAAVLVGALGAATSSPAVLTAAVAAITACFGVGQPALMEAVGNAVDPDVRGVALGVATLLFLTGGSVGAAVVGGLGDLAGFPEALLVVASLPFIGALGVRSMSPVRSGSTS